RLDRRDQIVALLENRNWHGEPRSLGLVVRRLRNWGHPDEVEQRLFRLAHLTRNPAAEAGSAPGSTQLRRSVGTCGPASHHSHYGQLGKTQCLAARPCATRSLIQVSGREAAVLTPLHTPAGKEASIGVNPSIEARNSPQRRGRGLGDVQRSLAFSLARLLTSRS